MLTDQIDREGLEKTNEWYAIIILVAIFLISTSL